MFRFLLALIALESGLGAEAATARVCDGAGSCIGQTLAPRGGERVVAQAAPTRFVALPRAQWPLRLAVAAGRALPLTILPPVVRIGIDRARV